MHLSRFADKAKLLGAVDTLEERDTMQRNLDRLGRWAYARLMKFNKGKYNVLYQGLGNAKHIYRMQK